ncbi:HET-domain-containing protein, partial [Ophiobolus disseminans]
LRTWLHQCNEHHGGDCHSILDPWARIDKIHPLLLVDVQQMCLIGQSQTPEDALYVALSYVWGPAASPFQTLRSNLAQLRTHGALSPVSVGNQLPRTIRDSMVVVQLLGLRYLWVDRLCIVQDDPTTKPHQLASMASIYSNAYFTIAAGEGDADSGLAGLSRDSARSQPFKVFHFSPSCTMIEKSPTRSRPAEGKGYNTRGWTFQEWAFSRRILVFHQQTVSWCCQRLRQQENGAEPNPYETVPQHPGREDGRHSMWTSWPNLETYLDVARRYSERTLGYQEDMLNAFAAFTNVFGRTMTGDMLYGVPELFFHGLLLFTFNPFQKSWRRICANEESSALLPSWSWVAW